MKTNQSLPTTQSPEQLIKELQINVTTGLTEQQVIDHRARFGSNTILTLQPRSIASIMFTSLKEPMMLLLLSIAILSLLLKKYSSAIFMVFEVIAYVCLELFNTFRADRTMLHLKKLSQPTSKVLRNGSIVEIAIHEIVIGDIIILCEGVIIPADAQLFESHGLIINESSLTGESIPVEKQTESGKNNILSSTMVVSGEGKAIVTAIGQNSEFGKISKNVQLQTEQQTVLQTIMNQLAYILAIIAIVVSIIIPTIGFLQHLDFSQMVLTWLSLTFLMIPCQPPIIITMALALAAFALASKKVIAKRLLGIENLGQISVIVSDKTGTITQSSMQLETFITTTGASTTLPDATAQKILLGLPEYRNDPTDQAVAASLPNIEKHHDAVNFISFSKGNPYRDIVYPDNDTFLHVFAGNPEIIVSKSKISDEQKATLLTDITRYAQQGKRITGYAWTTHPDLKEMQNPDNLEFLAIAVLKDPVRPGVAQTITTLEQAGIKTIIVTGDYATTAQAIGTEIGITGEVIQGKDVDQMTDKQLLISLAKSTIFARMAPTQKLRIVTLLEQQSEMVAVIGDGINDAPALKMAQAGIAMGKIGTDLAKDVSDLILVDDDYTHIPDAIKIARQALEKFKRGLTYYLTAKTILLTFFVLPLLVSVPFPFNPLQIILIELIMDLISSSIFLTEPGDQTVMQKKSEKMTDFINKILLQQILVYALPLSSALSFVYLHTFYTYGILVAQTTALITWLYGHILLAFVMKQPGALIMQRIFSNIFALFWLGCVTLIAYAMTNSSFIQQYLSSTPIPSKVIPEIILALILATATVAIFKKIRNE